MNRRRPYFATALATALIVFCPRPASPMTMKDFRRLSENEQGTYIGAAVSMIAYSYAVNGDGARARCVHDWYFGKGSRAVGVREIETEMGLAERLDADKYQAEGIILGMIEKACAAGPARR